MSARTIQNGCNVPLNSVQGTVPNMGEAITDYFQKLSFIQIVKTVVGFQLKETPTTTEFWGIYMPAGPRNMAILPAGQRAWTIYKLYTQQPLTLQVDDVVVFPQINNKQTRVMKREDYSQYGYIVYDLIQDFTGSGPT